MSDSYSFQLETGEKLNLQQYLDHISNKISSKGIMNIVQHPIKHENSKE